MESRFEAALRRRRAGRKIIKQRSGIWHGLDSGGVFYSLSYFLTGVCIWHYATWRSTLWYKLDLVRMGRAGCSAVSGEGFRRGRSEGRGWVNRTGGWCRSLCCCLALQCTQAGLGPEELRRLMFSVPGAVGGQSVMLT